MLFSVETALSIVPYSLSLRDFFDVGEAKDGVFVYTDIDSKKHALVAVPDQEKEHYPYAMWYKHTAITPENTKGDTKNECL